MIDGLRALASVEWRRADAEGPIDLAQLTAGVRAGLLGAVA